MLEQITYWKEQLPNSTIFPLSALNKFNVDTVMNYIKELVPECPPYFEKDALTDKSERFFVCETIREKNLEILQKEIPYSVEVEVEEFKQEEGYYSNPLHYLCNMILKKASS